MLVTQQALAAVAELASLLLAQISITSCKS